MSIIDIYAIDNLNSISCDVCIIGAGAGGLYLSRKLADRGINVVVLEAGGKVCADGESIGIVAGLSGASYGGVTEGRAFGLGGTTARWGGQLLPYSELDLRVHDSSGTEVWSHIIATVRKWEDSVAATLGLGGNGDYFALSEKLLGDAGKLFSARDLQFVASQWLPFRQRNFSGLINKCHDKINNPTIILHAVASNWRIAQSTGRQTRVTSVTALSGNGKSIEISAHRYVIAAGAVESARILLEIDRQFPAGAFRGRMSVGKFLSDHLSCAVAKVESDSAPVAIKMFGPRFIRGKFRSFRFVEKTLSPDVPRHFFHFIFDQDNPGFSLARKILSGIQSRRFPDIDAMQVIHGLSGIANLAYDRLCNSRLYIPKSATVSLYLDIEQAPDSENFVSIGDKTDTYGRPEAIVKWKIQEMDLYRIQETSQRFLNKWPGGSNGIPLLKAVSEHDLSGKPHDAFHPVGTCRMGTDSSAVVDLALRVHGCDNLSVLSTAVFPTAGSANPTFSLLCMAEELADWIVRELDK